MPHIVEGLRAIRTAVGGSSWCVHSSSQHLYVLLCCVHDAGTAGVWRLATRTTMTTAVCWLGMTTVT